MGRDLPAKSAFFSGRLARGVLWLVGLVALVALAFAVRAAAVAHFVDASVRVVRGVAASLPQPRRAEDPTDEPWPLFPLWPIEKGDPKVAKSEHPTSAPAAPAPASAVAVAKKSVVVAPPILPLPVDARATRSMVLSWAERQLVPRGIHRSAYGDLPAGIELSNVAALGIGLSEGDRLLSVDGVPVTERAQVIGAVLSARSRRAEQMTATLARRTTKGVKRFTVVVEQPYPEDLGAPVEEEDSDQMPSEAEGNSASQSARDESTAKDGASD